MRSTGHRLPSLTISLKIIVLALLPIPQPQKEPPAGGSFGYIPNVILSKDVYNYLNNVVIGIANGQVVKADGDAGVTPAVPAAGVVFGSFPFLNTLAVVFKASFHAGFFARFVVGGGSGCQTAGGDDGGDGQCGESSDYFVGGLLFTLRRW